MVPRMKYRHVCVEAFSCLLPPHVVTSAEIEARLKPVYDRLGLPEGRLELMTGIRERRFFDPGTRPGSISAQTVRQAVEQSGLDPKHFKALIHGSVCRDQLEPATATGVHAAAGLPQDAVVLDVSNACLGLLSGAVMIADMIELGRIRAGIVVGTEIGRPLVEGTIEKLLHDESLTRKTIKYDFASLTIGSGSAAIVLCDDRLSKTGNRLVGGACLADTTQHELCAGDVAQNSGAEQHLQMRTDSEALLHAGVGLARKTWIATKATLGWENTDVDRVFTHQVGKAHRNLLMQELGLPPDIDFPTVEFMGNTGAAALPTAAALGIQEGVVHPGHRVALLGIGSGLNSVMLGIEWNGK